MSFRAGEVARKGQNRVGAAHQDSNELLGTCSEIITSTARYIIDVVRGVHLSVFWKLGTPFSSGKAAQQLLHERSGDEPTEPAEDPIGSRWLRR